jgi:hypothetical protein
MVTQTQPLSDTTEVLNVSASVIELQPRKTYYYRLVATNDFTSSVTELGTIFTAVKPIISSYAPVSAPIGTEIIIVGQNFNPTSEKNYVSFGATRATVLSSSSTEIKVKVPAGASLGPITLLDAESGLTTESVQEFVPTFTGNFENGSLQLRATVDDLYIYHTLVEDMDGDGKPDIVVSHNQGFTVFQNVNTGGDITNESFIKNTYQAESYAEISLADFDGNGLKDIVFNRYRAGFRIYPNLSVPGYIFFGAPVDVPSGFSYGMAFNDFDNDGRIDIATIAELSDDSCMLILFRNQNPKGFLSADNFAQRYVMTLPYYGFQLYSDDLNNDGNLDLFAADRYKGFVPILKNNSYPGSFVFEEAILPDSVSNDYAQYISQDLNQDGWKDIASYSGGQIGNLGIFENKGHSSEIVMNKPIVALKDYA